MRPVSCFHVAQCFQEEEGGRGGAGEEEEEEEEEVEDLPGVGTSRATL